MVAEEEPLGGTPVDTLSSPTDDVIQGGGSLACEADAAACEIPDAGPTPARCVSTGPRDCTSDLDNDCDGQADNTIDDVCSCVAGTSEPCDEHPGLDGQGLCRAGQRSCLLDEITLTTAWSECEGAVGPGGQDSCEPADDTDCDGTPNEGCSCVDGETQSCGSSTNTGPCQMGTSTCVDGRFGPCVGAVAPASADSCSSRNDDSNCNGVPFDGCSCVNGETQPCGVTDVGVCQLGARTCVNGVFGQCIGQVNPRSRDCRSQQDNDCDGRPDNTIDTVCQCSIGSTQDCQGHPQDGVGRCRPGRQQCLAGQNNSSSSLGACTDSVGPAQRDACTTVNDDDCDGFTNDGCQCVSSRGNADCSGVPGASRCDGATGQCVPCQTNADCSLISSGRTTCENGVCIAPIVILPAKLTGTTTVDPPRAPLAGLTLIIYVDDSISGVVLTVTFTAAATNSATIVNEINAVTAGRVIASALQSHIVLATVEAGSGVFLDVYTTEGGSILGLTGLGLAEGQSP